MNKSESIKTLSAALAKFQAKNVRVTKDGTLATKQFTTKYATITSILDSIQRPLADCGLTFSQFPDGKGLTTILMHTSGEWIEATYQLNPTRDDPQGWGSAITYARRYSLGAILGLNVDEDDGGKTASESGLDDVIDKVRKCKTVNQITSIWRNNPGYKTNEDFVAEVKKRKEEIDGLVNARN